MEGTGGVWFSSLMIIEVWIYRRVLKISWMEKITNEDLLRRMGTGREIVRQFKAYEETTISRTSYKT